MNQENKFGEYLKKFLEYLRIFFSLCAAAVKGAWRFLCRVVRSGLQALAFLAMAIRDKAETLISGVRTRLNRQTAVEEPVREVYEYTIAEEGVAAQTPAPVEDAEEAAPETEAAEESLPETAAEQEQPEKAAAEASEQEQEAEEEDEKAEEEKKQEKPPVRFDDPRMQKAYEICWYICRGVKFAVKWLWKLRKVFMAIPVIWAAVKLAMENMDRLPEQVGLDLQSTGEFARMISRQEAVYWPLGITMFCLLLMFCAKKPGLPWVISIFTLVLPWLIWILNYIA